MLLSKTKYMFGLKCHKALWLEAHKKYDSILCESEPKYYKWGHENEKMARELFPGGEFGFIKENPGYQSAKLTQELISKGVETIYEATFIFDNTIAVIDILYQKQGKWHLYEIKSKEKIVEEFYDDVALQYYVVCGSGLSIHNAYIIYVNPKYYKNGVVNVKKYFSRRSVLKRILQKQKTVKLNIPIFHSLITQNKPCVNTGTHCLRPYPCNYYDYCN